MSASRPEGTEGGSRAARKGSPTVAAKVPAQDPEAAVEAGGRASHIAVETAGCAAPGAAAAAPAAGWTGGQYSLFRGLFGAYLAVHFAQLVPWGAELFSSAGAVPDSALSPLTRAFPNLLAVLDAPAAVTALLALGALLSVALAAGWHDRVAALLLWYLWACLGGRNPLIANPGLPYVGLLLLLHAAMPRAPYGSLAARGRLDPGGGWRHDRDLWRVAWILMAVGYSYSGATKLVSPSWVDGTALARVLDNPLARPGMLREALLALPDGLLRAASYGALAFELLFAPLALVRVARPWLWLAMLGMHLSLIGLIDFADLSLGMVVLHLFTFDPAWVRPRGGDGPTIVFYDGHCGLCHNTVRWLLAEDEAGARFRFAPLQGDTLASHFDERQRAALPDSIVARTPCGDVLVRSDAVAHLLRRLGGVWRLLGAALQRLPRPLRDGAYDGVARIRKRVFGTREQACPLLPPALQGRFLP